MNFYLHCLNIKKCTTVIETGANIYGLLNNNELEKKELFLNDISECNINELLDKTKNFIYIFEFNNEIDIIKSLENLNYEEIVYFRVKSLEKRETNDKIILKFLLKKYYNKILK